MHLQFSIPLFESIVGGMCSLLVLVILGGEERDRKKKGARKKVWGGQSYRTKKRMEEIDR